VGEGTTPLLKYVCVCVCVTVCLCVCVCIYTHTHTHTYTEKEAEKETERQGRKEIIFCSPDTRIHKPKPKGDC
jgi:hypothetical protein